MIVSSSIRWAFALATFSASSVAAVCTNETASVRKEWGEFTSSERLSYINGIQCMLGRPSKLSAVCPACLTAYDDFAAVHINMTKSIHLSGIFYSWHRHYLHLLERELQTNCGYPANLGLPYWNWALPEYQASLENTTLFDGSPTSLSGNGLAGKGCVTSGPFVNMTTRFGPFTIVQLFGTLPANWMDPNPRCLSRSFNNVILRTLNNPTNLVKASASNTVQEFQMISDIVALGGIHVGGHNAVGDTMRDIFSSPQDPAFFLHHSMLDRIWAMWQAQDSDKRRFQYFGTSTVGNQPDTPPVTNDTTLTFGVLGSDIKIGEVANPMAGPYCYRYT